MNRRNKERRINERRITDKKGILLKDWKKFIMWFSVQSMALASAIQITYQALPEAMKQSIHPKTITIITVIVLILGIFGRIIKQDKYAIK